MSLRSIIRFVALVSTGLLAGIFLGDRMGLGFARPALPASSFVQLQQIQHVHFVRMMPVLQIAALLSTLTWLFLLRSSVRSSQFAVIAQFARYYSSHVPCPIPPHPSGRNSSPCQLWRGLCSLHPTHYTTTAGSILKGTPAWPNQSLQPTAGHRDAPI